MDIVALLTRYLEKTTGVASFPAVPAERPDEFIVVDLTGGSRGTVLDYPSLAIQTWAATTARASEMADTVYAAMADLPYTNSGVTCVDSGHPYPFPSSEKIPRYQATYDLTAHKHLEEV